MSFDALANVGRVWHLYDTAAWTLIDGFLAPTPP